MIFAKKEANRLKPIQFLLLVSILVCRVYSQYTYCNIYWQHQQGAYSA